jgi:iron complex transport system ATP-binding protein
VRIRVEGVEVEYDSTPALRGVTVEFEAGRVTCVIGPNGAGKTTLLKTIARLVTPTRGAVYIDGRDYRYYRPRELAKLVAYVDPYISRTIPSTVFEFIATGRYPHQEVLSVGYGEEDLAVVERVSKELGVYHLLSRRLDQLSSGELQRVLIARALVQEPRVLLLDEPSAYLDIRYRLEVLDTVKRVTARLGKVTVVALHDLYLASLYSDLVVLLEGGRVVAVGSPEEVLRKDVVEPVYGVVVEETEVRGRRVLIPVDLARDSRVL